ncbi:MAG TPA: DUF2953 domain-containing protein [Acetivibrio sp.]|jgi:hypothetical protein|nr:DUF2953 domain-containing protein [Clostridium sp.]HOQ38069.1 DUF2953 domain-containing protein [Acetivibrio sp.]HPT91815.1 DUF2953 domain-containing protein [Acetivibrio sp.]HQA58262.1 DUF2953 domain-containing protein [Acetivibrio sp.]
MRLLMILGYVIIALIFLLTLIMIVPIEFKIHGEKYEKVFLKARVILFKGLIGGHFKLAGNEKMQIYATVFGFKKRIEVDKFKKLKSDKEKPKRKEKKREKIDFQKYLEPDFIECALISLKKVLRHIKPRKFIIEGRVGFEDPYVTGLMCAVLNVFYEVLKKANISIKTVFDDEVLEGRCLIQGRVIPAYIAYIALRLYFSGPVRIKQNHKFKEVKSYGN